MDVGVNCAAHTLQLGINDSLKELPARHKNVIELCRRVAKFLRLKSSEHKIKEHGIEYRRPRLDVITRWGSMYQMVRINLKLDFI